MDFAQAEQSYEQLERQLQAGEISEETYRERLNELRVRDAEGRIWMLQEGTGAWFVWNQGAWEPGEPPLAATEPPPMHSPVPVDPVATGEVVTGDVATGDAVTEPTPVPPMPAEPEPEAAPVTPDRGKNVFGLIWRLVLWAAVIGALVYGAVQADIETTGYLVIAGVAALVLLILLWQLLRTYEGNIERVRIEEETDEDGSTTTRRVTYAYVRTANNKVKKVKAKKGFERGDLVYKRVGDWGPRKAKE